MSHFSNLAKIEGVRTYQPFPAFRTVKWRAHQILKNRDSNAIECAASYVLKTTEDFKEEHISAQLEAHVRRLSENGGWELGYLQRDERHPDEPCQVCGTEDEIRDLLNNWPSDADDSPTYSEIGDIEALGEILCSGNVYQWDWIDGCKNASEAELYAVLALIKLDDAAKALFVTQQRTEQGIVIYQPATAMGIAKAIDAANFLIDAMDSVCRAQQEVYSAMHYRHKNEADRKIAAAWKIESVEIARNERKALAVAGVSAKLAADPKQKDKALVRECWDLWQKEPERYKGNAAFARDMLQKSETLKSQPVIERWCRAWGIELGTQPAE